jgi:two-component sensor histidine kinase
MRMSIIYRHKKILIITSLVLICAVCRSQLLLGPEQVPRSQKSMLEIALKNANSDIERARYMLRLSTIYLNDPFPRTFNLNQSLKLAKNAGSLSLKNGYDKFYNDALLLTGFVYLRKNLPDSAKALLSNTNDSTRFKLLLGLSNFYNETEDADHKEFTAKAMYYALQAKELCSKGSDSLKKILVAQELACINSYNILPAAETELLNVVKSMQSIGYTLLHYPYFQLSILAYYLGNYEKALNYSQLALKSIAYTKDSTNFADVILIHGCILRKIGRHEASIEDLKLALKYYQIQYGEEKLYDAALYLAEELVKVNRPGVWLDIMKTAAIECGPENGYDSINWFKPFANYYRLIKNYDKSLEYYKIRMKIQTRLNLKPDYYGLGQLYLESGNYAKAKPFLEKALQSIDYKYSLTGKAHLEYCLFLVDSASGNYVSAIRHLSKNKRYDDSIMRQSRADAIEKYKAEYETERKEAGLKLKDQQINLLTKDQQLKDAHLQKVNFIKNAALAGILVILTVAILMNVQYRQKKKDSNTIARINKQLQQSLAEKEWLLKEVNHRVKNNLQTIISLLESQAVYLEKDALQAIEISQHRIYAMSLIHQKLYQYEESQSIDMNSYLEEFIGYLKDSFDTTEIGFIIDVEHVQLNLQQAVPVALIVNEAVTNSIKYAFQDERDPKIYISMKEANDLVQLNITDNGRGFVLKKEDEGKSLGMQLIKGLTRELKGTVEIDTNNGTQLKITFRKAPFEQMTFIRETFLENES